MSDPTEPTLDADDCESGEPSWPRLVAANMSDLYGTGPNDVNVGWSWCVYDPDETDPPIAENIVVQEFAEELARRWNEHDHLLATLAEKDRHLADARALIDQAETAFAGVAPYFTGDAERRSEGMALLREALAALSPPSPTEEA